MVSPHSGKSVHSLMRKIAMMPDELKLQFLDNEIVAVSNYVARNHVDKDAKYALVCLTDARDYFARRNQNA